MFPWPSTCSPLAERRSTRRLSPPRAQAWLAPGSMATTSPVSMTAMFCLNVSPVKYDGLAMRQATRPLDALPGLESEGHRVLGDLGRVRDAGALPDQEGHQRRDELPVEGAELRHDPRGPVGRLAEGGRIGRAGPAGGSGRPAGR